MVDFMADLCHVVCWSWSLCLWCTQFHCNCQGWKRSGFLPCFWYVTVCSFLDMHLFFNQNWNNVALNRIADYWSAFWWCYWWCCPVLQGCLWQGEAYALWAFPKPLIRLEAVPTGLFWVQMNGYFQMLFICRVSLHMSLWKVWRRRAFEFQELATGSIYFSFLIIS